jgi:hypothetical protein
MAKSTRTTKKPSTPGETATTTRARTTKERTPNGGVDKDAIARRAYEIFQARGGQHGYEIEDWLQAERELAGRQDGR